MAGYRDLTVWQRSMDLVEDIYRLIHTFPKSETYALSDQMKRCAVPIPSNIAEGSARNSIKEFIQFLHIALGSLYELQTQLEISRRIGYHAYTGDILTKINEIEKMLNALITSMKKRV